MTATDLFAEELAFDPSRVQAIRAYDAGRHPHSTFPAAFVPSNPAAFAPSRFSVKGVYQAELASVNAQLGLSSYLGIDLEFFGCLDTRLSLLRKNAPKETADRLLNSPAMQALARRDHFPTRSEWKNHLQVALNEETRRQKLDLPPIDCRKEIQPSSCDNAPPAPGQAIHAQGNCMGCHSGTGTRLDFPWDPENRETWKTKMQSPEGRRQGYAFKARLIERMGPNRSAMPPSDSDEATTFTPEMKEEFFEFLKGL